MKPLILALLLVSLKSDPNPGRVDDPGCRTLINNHIRLGREDPKNYTIVYTGTDEMPDHQGGMNIYTVTQKFTGAKMQVIVAIHFGPAPSPTPTPAPVGFMTTQQ